MTLPDTAPVKNGISYEKGQDPAVTAGSCPFSERGKECELIRLPDSRYSIK